MRRRLTRNGAPPAREPVLNGFCEWVASLPFVVERPLGDHDSRIFAVDCDLIARRRTWLVVSHDGALPSERRSVVVVVPRWLADRGENTGLGTLVAPMPRNHVLFKARPGIRHEDLEPFILAAYCCAMA